MKDIWPWTADKRTHLDNYADTVISQVNHKYGGSKGVFRPKAMNTMNATRSQCKDAIRCDVTSRDANLAIQALRIM